MFMFQTLIIFEERKTFLKFKLQFRMTFLTLIEIIIYGFSSYSRNKMYVTNDVLQSVIFPLYNKASAKIPVYIGHFTRFRLNKNMINIYLGTLPLLTKILLQEKKITTILC